MEINGGQAKPDGQQEKEFEFTCTGPDYVLIQPGNYEVVFVEGKIKKQWKGYKAFLWFQVITHGEFYGTKIFMACNVQPGGKISTRSKYFRNWVIAKGRKPDRSEMKRMTNRVFLGKVFLGKVRTVTHDKKNLPIHTDLQYSTIDELIERLTISQ